MATHTTLAAATKRAAFRLETAYASGQRDGLEVVRLLVEQTANRAEYVAALGCLAKSSQAAYRKHPGGYWLGQADAARDMRG